MVPVSRHLHALGLRTSHARPLYRSYSSVVDSLPRVAQPALWRSLVPKFMRPTKDARTKLEKPRSKDWNPATFYIIIFLLIGSNAVHLIALRNQYSTFSRRSDARIGVLKDVLERLQKGETVDVEGLLGTGDPEKEDEWEQVLKEITEDDQQWLSKKERKARKLSEEAELAAENSKLLKATSSIEALTSTGRHQEGQPRQPHEPRTGPKFY